MRSLQAAFRALCLGLILPLAMFVFSELVPHAPARLSADTRPQPASPAVRSVPEPAPSPAVAAVPSRLATVSRTIVQNVSQSRSELVPFDLPASDSEPVRATPGGKPLRIPTTTSHIDSSSGQIIRVPDNDPKAFVAPPSSRPGRTMLPELEPLDEPQPDLIPTPQLTHPQPLNRDPAPKDAVIENAATEDPATEVPAQADYDAPAQPTLPQPIAPQPTTPSPSVAPQHVPVIRPAQPAGDPTRDATIEIVETMAGRFNVTLHSASLPETLQQLSRVSRRNLILGNGVAGRVTGALYDVSLEDALSAILKPGDFVYTVEPATLYVSTRSESIVRDRRQRQVSTRIYLPQYLSIDDLRGLIQPLLTPELGRISLSRGGLPTAADDAVIRRGALLVQDVEEILADVDAIVDELDTPPRELSIDAVVIRLALNPTIPNGVQFAALHGPGQTPIIRDLPTAPPSHARPFDGLGHAQPVVDTGVRYGLLEQNLATFTASLKAYGEPTVVTSSNLMILDRQSASLNVGRRPVNAAQPAGGGEPVLKVHVRPLVSYDNSIRLDVRPERSASTAGEALSMTGQAMVRDGQTLVLGGIIDSRLETSQSHALNLTWLPAKPVTKLVRTEWLVLLTPRLKSGTAGTPATGNFFEAPDLSVPRAFSSGPATSSALRGSIRRIRSGLNPWADDGDTLTRPAPASSPSSTTSESGWVPAGYRTIRGRADMRGAAEHDQME